MEWNGMEWNEMEWKGIKRRTAPSAADNKIIDI